MKTLLKITFALLLVSCASTKVLYPKPERNPVVLTSDAQAIRVYVMHFFVYGMDPENPETDKVEANNIETEITNYWKTIENDWIKIKAGDNLPDETIEITVKENTTGKPRSYKLITSYAGIYETIITITQQ